MLGTEVVPQESSAVVSSRRDSMASASASSSRPMSVVASTSSSDTQFAIAQNTSTLGQEESGEAEMNTVASSG